MPEEIKETRPLQRIFSEVPDTYDFINRLFTLGLDGVWRARAAEECIKGRPRRMLDLCTGTGDLALSMAGQTGSVSNVTGVDFSLPMLRKALFKASGSGKKVALVLGDAARLPFLDRSFDAIGIAFAFRNLTFRNSSREQYLSEILRILAPEGKFVIVESSRPRSAGMRALYHWYMRTVVSFMGGIISGHRSAYRYLAHSAINFYSPAELTGLLVSAGFGRVEYQTLLFGVATMHVAYKKKDSDLD
jgi:demethylmenaquinone methyltransferase/2-methoxy-6-polyprenyl-1,4-benzoquinol methylase